VPWSCQIRAWVACCRAASNLDNSKFAYQTLYQHTGLPTSKLCTIRLESPPNHTRFLGHVSRHDCQLVTWYIACPHVICKTQSLASQPRAEPHQKQKRSSPYFRFCLTGAMVLQTNGQYRPIPYDIECLVPSPRTTNDKNPRTGLTSSSMHTAS
jgi:hypothetical protein